MNVRQIFGISKDKRDNIRQTYICTHIHISVVATWALSLLLDPPSIPLSPPLLRDDFLCVICVSVVHSHFVYFAAWPSALRVSSVHCDCCCTCVWRTLCSCPSCGWRLECACVWALLIALFWPVALCWSSTASRLRCCAWSVLPFACLAPEGAREHLFACVVYFCPGGFLPHMHYSVCECC